MNHCWAANRSLLWTACLILTADALSKEWRKDIQRKAGALSAFPMSYFSTSWEEVLWNSANTWLILDPVFQGERIEKRLPESSIWKKNFRTFLCLTFEGIGSLLNWARATKRIPSNLTPEAASQGWRAEESPAGGSLSSAVAPLLAIVFHLKIALVHGHHHSLATAWA